MSSYQVDSTRKYFNFGGGMPPLQLEETPAEVPALGSHTYPKLITDTTLRDGAQDPCFAIFPNEAKLKYFDLLVYPSLSAFSQEICVNTFFCQGVTLISISLLSC